MVQAGQKNRHSGTTVRTAVSRADEEIQGLTTEELQLTGPADIKPTEWWLSEDDREKGGGKDLMQVIVKMKAAGHLFLRLHPSTTRLFLKKKKAQQA